MSHGRAIILFMISLKFVHGSPWELVYIVCGTDTSSPLDLWLDPLEGSSSPLNTPTAACTKHEKSHLVNYWEHLAVFEARVVVHAGGDEKAWITFDTRCKETTDWFTYDRIKDSSYEDLFNSTTLDTNTAFYDYNTDSSFRSMFHVAEPNPSNCYSNATGWISVSLNPDSANCAWQTGSTSMPHIYYSPGTSKSELPGNVGDFVAVWIRYKNENGPNKNHALDFADKQRDGYLAEEWEADSCEEIACSAGVLKIDLGDAINVGAVTVNQVPAAEMCGGGTNDGSMPSYKVYVSDIDTPTPSEQYACDPFHEYQGTRTIYCRKSTPGRYVYVKPTSATFKLVVCEVEVYSAKRVWTHDLSDYGNEPYTANENVDMAENITIIPNPDRPLSHKGVITGWTATINLDNYAVGGSATVYFQVWRPTATENELQLVGSTQRTFNAAGTPTVDLGSGEQIAVEKGDLIGISMPGKGSVVYEETGNETKCIYVQTDRAMVDTAGTVMAFTSVWMEDWHYKVEATLEKNDTDSQWKKIYHTQTEFCLSAFLEHINCTEDDPVNPDKSVRWKLTSDGFLINKWTYLCLDVDIVRDMYLPGTSSCYDVAWGQWELIGTGSGTQIKNVLLDKCLMYDAQCGTNGITNTYLAACALGTETQMTLEDEIVHGRISLIIA